MGRGGLKGSEQVSEPARGAEILTKTDSGSERQSTTKHCVDCYLRRWPRSTERPALVNLVAQVDATSALFFAIPRGNEYRGDLYVHSTFDIAIEGFLDLGAGRSDQTGRPSGHESSMQGELTGGVVRDFFPSPILIPSVCCLSLGPSPSFRHSLRTPRAATKKERPCHEHGRISYVRTVTRFRVDERQKKAGGSCRGEVNLRGRGLYDRVCFANQMARSRWGRGGV